VRPLGAHSLRQPPAATLSPPCGPGPSVFTPHANEAWDAPRFPGLPAGGGPRRSRSGVARSPSQPPSLREPTGGAKRELAREGYSPPNFPPTKDDFPSQRACRSERLSAAAHWRSGETVSTPVRLLSIVISPAGG